MATPPSSHTRSNNAAEKYSVGAWMRYGLFRTFIFLCSLLSLRHARAIGGWLGTAYYKMGSKRVAITRINIEICHPKLARTEQEQLVKESFRQAGMWVMETGAVWLWRADKLLQHIAFENAELLQNAVDGQQGVIVAVPHLGNWELMSAALARYGQPAYFYQRDKHNPLIGEFIRRVREKNGALLASADLAGIRVLYKHLRANKLVGMLPDHTPTKDMGVFAPFYGCDCLTGTLISQLAQKNQVPVIMAAAVRTAEGFTVHYFPVTDQHQQDSLVAATAVNHAIAQAIALAPPQFQWVYPRFSKQRSKATVSPYKHLSDRHNQR